MNLRTISYSSSPSVRVVSITFSGNNIHTSQRLCIELMGLKKKKIPPGQICKVISTLDVVFFLIVKKVNKKNIQDSGFCSSKMEISMREQSKNKKNLFRKLANII